MAGKGIDQHYKYKNQTFVLFKGSLIILLGLGSTEVFKDFLLY